MTRSITGDLTLVIGNKNYSSWSMRPFLALKKTGRPFQLEEIPLRQANTRARILAHSGAGRVPVLHHGAMTVWESLAICEYLAETFPDAALWPADPTARAHARAISTEMHASFNGLRSNMPMDLIRDRRHDSRAHLVGDEIARVATLWGEALGRWGAKGGGPFLYGDFTNADAMFAPMVSRFRTYGVTLDAACSRYMNAVLDSAAFKEWEAGAAKETAIIEFDIFAPMAESVAAESVAAESVAAESAAQ